jgi:alpha-galactosidase
VLSGAPDRVFVFGRDLVNARPAQRKGARWQVPGVEITVAPETGGGTAVSVHAPAEPLSRILLRWETSLPAEALYLGDHWERGYGDLQWRHLQPERVLPWYFLAHQPQGGGTLGVGVRTQPGAFCFWTADAEGVSLWLDVRNGAAPLLLGDRVLAACTVVARHAAPAITPFQAARDLCRGLCPAPLLPTRPVCGNNNWYYTYGLNFDQHAVRRDAAFLAELAGDHPVRPFSVIDAGWTTGSCVPGGPWTHGDPVRFPDMPGLAADIRACGVRPGIWTRASALTVVDRPARLRAGPHLMAEKPLDLTLPENLAIIGEDFARLRGWGYELIKHDFSTFDALGKWGFEFGGDLTSGDWHFADRSVTNAEVLLNFYRVIREHSGDAVLIGCNVVGHLAAGLVELQRTGDDTSGQIWERTRRMGVNTLAFRLPQHGTFFSADADCVAHTPSTPWAQDRQFLDLVARSGTPLFFSLDPTGAAPGVKAAFGAALRLALDGGAPGGLEPLDWLHTTCPARWRDGEGEHRYRWTETTGALPVHPNPPDREVVP